jgi:hypothetical protein
MHRMVGSIVRDKVQNAIVRMRLNTREFRQKTTEICTRIRDYPWPRVLEPAGQGTREFSHGSTRIDSRVIGTRDEP